MRGSVLLLLVLCPRAGAPRDLDLPPNTWVKLTPLPGGPPSPRLGYEGACAWDAKHQVLLRYGGHNQGGGGEQHSEVWTFDPRTREWALKEPDTSPPGVCCAQQDIFDPVRGRFLRFPAFSGSHGWQWWREIYLFTIPSSPRWVFARESGSVRHQVAGEPGEDASRLQDLPHGWTLRRRGDPAPHHGAHRRHGVLRPGGGRGIATLPRRGSRLAGPGRISPPLRSGSGREWRKFYEPFTGEWHQ